MLKETHGPYLVPPLGWVTDIGYIRSTRKSVSSPTTQIYWVCPGGRGCEYMIDHINLIVNHDYDGYIAIYDGPDQMSIRKGKPFLVRNSDILRSNYIGDPTSIQWEKDHRTIEYPHSEDHIKDNISKYGHKGITTICSCVGVPANYLKEIKIS